MPTIHATCPIALGRIGPALALVLALTAPACVTPGVEDSGPPLEEPFRVLLIGDSISMGYTAFVQELLAGRARVVRPLDEQGRFKNCEGTNAGVEQLDEWLATDGGSFDVIHFNFGLHDLKRVDPRTGENSTDPDHPHQASLERYEAQLRSIVRRLQATEARLVFATTTPVPKAVLSPYRASPDAVAYNRVARRVMREEKVPVNDLFEFVTEHDEPLLRPGDVHFNGYGSRILAQRVVSTILELADLEQEAD